MELLIQRMDTLFEEIKHGDADHQKWLKQAITDHFSGIKPQPACGKGTKEALQTKINELEAQLVLTKRKFMITRQDINYFLAHTLSFFL